MRMVIKKWGNSASVRIPAAIMEAAKLSVDAVVDVREENGRIVIEPLPDAESELDVLIAGITAENLHEEVDFGPRVGKELL
ncbi:AbrB/MazE/SpoVT family DNA-binding domain-containing protein [Cupriavidus sp. H18C1]|jgi:Growth regulator|nr:AbrB/MazE/SpoVT family DNA-binding domain-containing protein [Cupriavidus cauae]